MKKLLYLMKDHLKECILAPLFKCLEACVDLIVPLLMARLIDIGIGGNNTSYIVKIGILLIVLAACGLALSSVAQWFSAKAAVNFAANVRSKAFSHIEHLSFSKQDSLGTATLITRLTSDVNMLQTGVNMTLRLFLRSPFIVFGSVIMAFTVDTHAAWIFAAAVPLLAIVVYGIMAITVPLYKKVQARLDKVTQATRDNLTGVRVIRAFNLQSSETNQFLDQNEKLTQQSKHVGLFSALTNPLTYILINLATALLLYVGAIRVNVGALTQGQVIALVNYMAQILVELVKLANLIVTISRSIAAGNRVQAILDTPIGMQQSESPAQTDREGSVDFDHVSLTYEGGGDPALSDITFKAEPGQTIGIIGGTGSGKSSLVNLIPRFYDVSSGSVKVDGVDVKDLPMADLRQEVGIVLQKPILFAGTIRSNLQFGNPDATDQEIWQALKDAQAEDFVRQKPKQLDEAVEQGGRNFSGGQRQRLSIARALIRKPRILILDDSSSALDFATDAALREAIHHLSYHPTTFIVSQRVASILYADKILVLADGRLMGEGTHEELLKTCQVYREIYESQIKKEDMAQ